MDWLERLRYMKNQSGLTTREIAFKSGIPEPTLEKLFAGQTKDPKLNTMKLLVHCLGYTLDDLAPASQSSIKKAPALPVEAIKVAQDYNTLDDHGRRAVRAILNEEIDRMQGSATPLSPDTPSVKVGNVAARGGGVHAPDEEELKDMQAVYEKLVLPAEERKKRRSRGGK